jgi:hypothetical protein
MEMSAITVCRVEHLYVERKAEVSAKEVYRRGRAVPAIRLKPPGTGNLRRLADVLNPPQNVGRAQLMCGVSSRGPWPRSSDKSYGTGAGEERRAG